MKPTQCLTFAIPVFLIPFILLLYTSCTFPNPNSVTMGDIGGPVSIHSLSNLPKEGRSWEIYPEDYYGGGEYVRFPQGRTRYWMIGPEKGKKIILIHGLSIPSLIYTSVAPSLAQQGFRVLLYDLYGRGYSDSVEGKGEYDTTLYTTQLALLMQRVGWDKAGVVGVSMGGAIATAFADLFPHLVSGQVALIASAGLIESKDISRTVKFMSSPIAQTFAASLPFKLYLRHLANTSIPSTSPSGPQNPSYTYSNTNLTLPMHEIVRIQSAHLPGYNKALASSIRSGPVRGLAPSFKRLGESGRKVLLIHGTQDKTVPYSHSHSILRLLAEGGGGDKSAYELVTVEGATHDVTVTHANVVYEALRRFFSAKDVWVWQG